MLIDGFFEKRLLGYLAGFVPAQDESLSEHDAKYHPDGFEDGDSCKFRENRKKGDKADAGVGETKSSKPSVTPEEDAAYMDAVKRGDVETAARMVREAAARAMPDTKVVGEDGKPLVVYHGTANLDFTKFDDGKVGSATGNKGIFGKGHYFTESFELAKQYGYVDGKQAKENRVVKCFLNLGKVFDFDEAKMASEVRMIAYPESRIRNGKLLPLNNEANIEEVTRKMKDVGYDGSSKRLGNSKQSPSEYVSFFACNIKSADPVTYDDDGNVIPLSKRFDMKNPDIRW